MASALDIAILQRRAAEGDAEARRALVGHLLKRGPGRDLQGARRLLREGCDEGDTQAMRLLASLNAAGVGGPQDWSRAIARLSQAATAGDALARAQIDLLADATGQVDLDPWFKPAPVTQHCDTPRIYTVKGLLRPDVCAWLTQRARPALEPTLIKHPKLGRIHSEARSNTGAEFNPIDSDLIFQLVSARIANAVGVERSFHEFLYVLHYATGQQYTAHFDFLTPEDQVTFAAELERYGQRVATVLVYLNDDYEGGETSFPHLNWRFKGETGDALVFFNLSQAGELERFSLHAGLPVESGEKWLLSQWIRQKPYGLIE